MAQETPHYAQSVYVFNGPLQYFLCRLIEIASPSPRSRGIQYIEPGDFSKAFLDIDAILGPSPFEISKFKIGDRLDLGPTKKLFLSNRFNSAEVEIYIQNQKNVEKLCAFEDGLSLYISHYFQDAEWNDKNYPLVIKNWLKKLLRNNTNFREKNIRPSFFLKKEYDEFYSIFPDIPGARPDAQKHSLKSAFRELASTENSESNIESTAIILSQSIVKDGFLDAKKYSEIMINLIEEIRPNYSKIIFKAHPRDNQDMIDMIMNEANCVTLPDAYGKVPVELYLARNQHVATYGFWSSSLAYAAGGLGMKAYTFAPELIQRGGNNSNLLKVWKAMEPVLVRHGVKYFS